VPEVENDGVRSAEAPLDRDGLPLHEPIPLDAHDLPLEQPVSYEQGEVAGFLAKALQRHAERADLPWDVRVDEPVDYREDGVRRRVYPDAYVLVGPPFPAARQKMLRTWALGRGPTVAFEVSSAESLAADRGDKKAIYARLGVLEYFVFDLDQREVPGLIEGWRLDDGAYQPIGDVLPRAGGPRRLPSAVLGLELEVVAEPRVEAGQALRAFQPGAERPLPTPLEAERDAAAAERDAAAAERDAAAAERDAAAAERDAARGRVAELEAELRRRDAGEP